ncbi:AAA family ATPase [Cupriavidus taiwanensis]|uniref:ATP-binding protein n=1 Tax=Cupriavidus taiwanensis TaxID=164546 RepID=UPI001571AE07|nr:ATP-binding protein [Cupriavidus taiwanensis]NSX16168.1 AAA family ATPase [Cupriavidus taiwanensis]
MVVLIAGVHAVGKSYLAAPLAERLRLRHATASQLIKAERGKESWGNDKTVSDVDGNQRALVRAVSTLRSDGEVLLLDGHLVLRGHDGKNVRLPLEVFRDLDLDGIVLLEAPTDVILERLELRKDISWDHEAVSTLACAEREHAHEVAESLHIPLVVLSSPSEAEFRNAVETIIAARSTSESKHPPS